MQEEWVAALEAFALDLRCGRHGWELAVVSQDWMSIGMAKSTMLQIWANSQSVGVSHSGRFPRKRWCGSPQQFKTNWPAMSSCSGRRTAGDCLPRNSGDSEAVWLDPSTGSVVTVIGALCDAAEAPCL
jgi:hypothetical protein